MAFWHTFKGDGSDPFGSATKVNIARVQVLGFSKGLAVTIVMLPAMLMVNPWQTEWGEGLDLFITFMHITLMDI